MFLIYDPLGSWCFLYVVFCHLSSLLFNGFIRFIVWCFKLILVVISLFFSYMSCDSPRSFHWKQPRRTGRKRRWTATVPWPKNLFFNGRVCSSKDGGPVNCEIQMGNKNTSCGWLVDMVTPSSYQQDVLSRNSAVQTAWFKIIILKKKNVVSRVPFRSCDLKPLYNQWMLQFSWTTYNAYPAVSELRNVSYSRWNPQQY